MRNEADSQDRDDLRRAMVELTAAQSRTEESLRHLAGRIDELATAQARTEKALQQLAVRTDELAAAQTRTEVRLEELAAAQARTERALGRLAQQVGGLSDTIGGEVEDWACGVIYYVLQHEFGWKVSHLRPSWEIWNGTPEEVDVFGTANDPASPRQTIWVIGEAKHNATSREVDRFVRKLDRARRHLIGRIFPVVFCHRARPDVQDRIKEAKLNLVFSDARLNRPEDPPDYRIIPQPV